MTLQPLRPVNRRGQLVLDELGRLGRTVERQDRRATAGGVLLSQTAGAPVVLGRPSRRIWTRITSGSLPYAHKQQALYLESGALVAHDYGGVVGTTTDLPAWEINGNTGVPKGATTGALVDAFLAPSLDHYLFDYCCFPSCCPGVANPAVLYFHFSAFSAPFDFLNGTTATLNPVVPQPSNGTGVLYQGPFLSHTIDTNLTVVVRPFVACVLYGGTYWLYGGLPTYFVVASGFCDPTQFTLDPTMFCGTFDERARPGPRTVAGECRWSVNIAHDFPTQPNGPLYVAYQCGGARPIDVTSTTVGMYFIDSRLITLPCLVCVPNCPDGIVTRSTGTIHMNETP